MTLVELLVAFLILSVLFVTLVSVSGQMVSDATNADQRTQMYSEAQLVMDTMTREIAAASYAGDPPELIAYAAPDEITFYSALSSDESGVGPEEIDITLTGTDLVETTWAANAGSGGVGWTYSGSGSAQTLATDVDSSHGSLFSYYSISQNPVTTPGTSLTDSPALQQAGSGTGAIEAVRIDLWADPNGAGQGPTVELTTAIHLLNYDYTYDNQT